MEMRMAIQHVRRQRTQSSQGPQGRTCARNPQRAPRALCSLDRTVFLGVVIEIAQTTRLDAQLQIGAVSEDVHVAGESPLVRSTTAELGQVIQMKQIQA